MSSPIPGGLSSSLMRKSPLEGRTLAPAEKPAIDNFEGVCRPGDPQGKRSVRANGTSGRVYSQELRANNQTPAERAKSEAAFKRAMMCENGITGRLACNQPILEVTNASFEVSDGGMAAGVEASKDGLRTTYMAPTGNGTSMGTEGVQYGIGGSKLPKVKGGLCVALKGSKAPEHSVKAEVSGGIVGGSANGHEVCLFAQTPAPPEATFTVK
ncbi:hypothetical protein [Chondromyces apiculatus]|uniref:Uncharacterized protein n=1 Tax=Chondromyces apiculatus DSM 436 TaxID=1192034 RepID=A0A017TFR2_9BACT|nr:hypothetical protein [Chondromyces apiculatus]EYF08044.1 Hypothetical protein CAP_5804 [Chondromyces apiculatus DSM 436]